MQNPISSSASFRRGATRALRFIVAGSGTVLNVTGTALTGTGRVLKVCGRTLRIFAATRPHRHSAPSAQATPQPAD